MLAKKTFDAGVIKANHAEGAPNSAPLVIIDPQSSCAGKA